MKLKVGDNYLLTIYGTKETLETKHKAIFIQDHGNYIRFLILNDIGNYMKCFTRYSRIKIEHRRAKIDAETYNKCRAY